MFLPINFGFHLICVQEASILYFIGRRHDRVDTRLNEVWKL